MSLALSRPSEGGSARLACGQSDGSVDLHDLRDLTSGGGLGAHDCNDWVALGLGGVGDEVIARDGGRECNGAHNRTVSVWGGSERRS